MVDRIFIWPLAWPVLDRSTGALITNAEQANRMIGGVSINSGIVLCTCHTDLWFCTPNFFHVLRALVSFG